MPQTETQIKIRLEAAKLFSEKGYDETTIQDIINAVGMSKGAIYHYYKSKEEIFEAIWQDDQVETLLSSIIDDKSTNGCEKIQMIFSLSLSDIAKQAMDKAALPLYKNAKLVEYTLRVTYGETTSTLQALIEIGIADGSIQTKNPKELASLLALITNFWINPALYPASREEILVRCQYACEMLSHMGLALDAQAITDSMAGYYNEVFIDG